MVFNSRDFAITISVTTSRKPWMGLKALALKINDWNGTHYI